MRQPIYYLIAIASITLSTSHTAPEAGTYHIKFPTEKTRDTSMNVSLARLNIK